MFQDVFNYKPQEQDYRIWLVLNPAVWLVPILMSVFVLGILIHALLFSVSPYGEYWGGSSEAATEEAAPAPAAE
ncbi:MAG: light-harvesting antenna LH1, alpha subunit [Halochromatium sp.]|uniref:light-harvesting antenna LH1, alpha subunit n=1 Tax=Halochromatium sp. TaxID=2049430 RepID=UPI00397A2260